MDNLENKDVATVPLIVYEKERDRHERADRRKLIVTILLIILLFASNMAWLCVFNSYDRVSYSQDGEGINNVNIGEQGDIINEPESSGYTETQETD